jgi:hypothetical protein
VVDYARRTTPPHPPPLSQCLAQLTLSARTVPDDSQYFQCLPGSGGWSSSGSGSGSTLNLWDQCGGKGGNCNSYTCVDSLYPGQSCPAGSNCQRLLLRPPASWACVARVAASRADQHTTT